MGFFRTVASVRIGPAAADVANRNRLVKVRVHYSVLETLLHGRVRPAVSDLPPDAEIVDMGFDGLMDRLMSVFTVVLRSKGFDEIAEGNRIPEREVWFRTRTDETREGREGGC